MTDLLEPFLDSWQRSNRVLIGLLDLISNDRFAAKATPSGMSVSAMFGHIVHMRMAMVHENAPEHATIEMGYDAVEYPQETIRELLNTSAESVGMPLKAV